MVRQLSKPGADIVAEMTPTKAHILHMAVGICGEAGELADAIKKHVIYGKPLDLTNVVEELGDLEFFMEGLRQELGLDRDDTIRANIDKLILRYPNLDYADSAAIDRADKLAIESVTEFRRQRTRHALDVHDAYLVVRAELLKRIDDVRKSNRKASLWFVSGMQYGDESEFAAMMMNVESVLGLPEVDRFDWFAWADKLP